MGWGGTVLKYILVNLFIIAFWEIGSWILSIIFSIPTGQITLFNQTITLNVGITPNPMWTEGWKPWAVWGWNLIPIFTFIGNTLWLYAKSQEKDTAVVNEPLGPW